MSQNPYEPVQQPDNFGAPQDPYAAGQPGNAGYQAPAQQPFQGQAQQFSQPAQYSQPAQFGQQQGGYQQQPYGGAQASPDNGFGNLQLNLWLSVFFSWIPALIFWLTDKDKTVDPVRKANGDNLSFQLLRVIVGVCSVIPFLGILAGIASIGLFVVAIINAVQVPSAIREGRPAKLTFAPSWIK